MDKFSDPSGDPYHYGAGIRRRKRTSFLCSCVVATLFLLVAAAALAAVFFTLFRPRDPGIQVTAVRLPSYGASGGGEGGNGTVRFTFEQLAAVRNPNRATFSHYDSSLQLSYGGAQVGFMFIPAGEIGGGRTQYMAASFSVDSLQSAGDDGSGGGGGGGGKMELQTRMRVRGRVRVLPFLMHHVETTAACRVVVAVRDGSVVGFHC